MFKLQDSYNQLKETALTSEQASKLNEELISLRKQLAVEKRGMSFSQVSEILEGATTEEDIESRLNSLASLGRNRQTKISIEKSALTESSSQVKKLTGLASIISRV